ncbi:MAG: MlaA family lipoprotein, partial [Pseudohongiella sp.]|nr:MlaA family lipoprotein [Pseudohongiella sp.]
MLGKLDLPKAGKLLAGISFCMVSQFGHTSESDPWESWNLRVHAFNEHLDAAVLRPVATTYVR